MATANIVDTDVLADYDKEYVQPIMNEFTGATTSAAGVKGLVPAPTKLIDGEDYFLCSDGTWKKVDTSIVKSFAQATDEEITLMLGLHRSGIIDLSTVWAVGEERPVHLSAMEATGVGETHVEQDATLVILHGPDMFELSDGGKNAFVIGLKNMLANNGSREGGYINSSNTNVGGWNSSARRPWCDNVFMKALPAEVQGWFKKFKYKVSAGNNSTTIETLENYFTFPAEIEVFGTTTYSVAGEGSLMKYYETAANRKKYPGDSSTSASYWWERSPRASYTTNFCIVDSNGGASYTGAYSSRGLAPFGCV